MTSFSWVRYDQAHTTRERDCMSGGSYDYICFKIEEIELFGWQTNPRRAAFQQLLKLVAKAMHDIEWVDSGDYGPGDENAAIDACFTFLNADAETIKKAAAFDSLAGLLEKFLEE